MFIRSLFGAGLVLLFTACPAAPAPTDAGGSETGGGSATGGGNGNGDGGPGVELSCGNGLDDDADLLTDCADPDCESVSCSDQSSCTTGDVCSAGTCMGAPVGCAAPSVCRAAGTCSDPMTGLCSYAITPNVTCDDGRRCTINDNCTAAGDCLGAPLGCAPAASCHAAGQCDEATGACSYAVTPGSTCNDNDACTLGDSCDADGGCTGGPRVICTPPSECSTAAGCGADGGCQFQLRTGACGDGGLCAANGACLDVPTTTFTYAPSNFALSDLPVTDGGARFTVSCSPVVLSSSGAPDGGPALLSGSCVSLPPWKILTQPDGGDAVLFALDDFQILPTFKLTLTGTRPIIFGVRGSATLSGELDLDGVGTGGAGSGQLCSAGAGQAGGPSCATGSGGGGAGFATPGTPGSIFGGGTCTQSPGDAGAAVGDRTLIPLRAGCPGGAGGYTGGQPGGSGGGAVQLSVAARLTISGVVHASGDSGKGAQVSNSGGSGGGSGGAILLEAAVLTFTPTARVTANGGGGGGGSATPGFPGFNGQVGIATSITRAYGGPGGGNWSGTGGPGGSAEGPPLAATQGGRNCSCGGGAGGGGAAGRIRLNAQLACTTDAATVFSPLPTAGAQPCP